MLVPAPAFPVLKILVPQAKVTLLDGHAKRFLFLNDFMQQSGLTCQTLHSRAELAAKQPEYREQFQYATARAVAALPTLLEYCLPFVKPGGLFAAMKGPGAGEEAAAAANAAGLLGGSPAAVQTSARWQQPYSDLHQKNIANFGKIPPRLC